MKIANIYPVKNQQHYLNEQCVMILAHLVKKQLYKQENFNKKSYIIMDNGLFEGQQVSISLYDCIKLAEQSNINVNEIIIPDAINDSNKTKQLFLQNIQTIEQYQHKYKFMFVAQAKNYQQLDEMINFINDYNFNLSVGISKLCPFDRGNKQVVEIYKKCKHPIHLLGLKESFSELENVKDVIRSCDSSQLSFMAKNLSINEINNIDIKNYKRKGIDIDLEEDCLDESKLQLLLLKYTNTRLL